VIVDFLNHTHSVEVIVAFQSVPWTFFLGCPIASRSRSQCASSVFEDGTIAEASPWGARLIDDEPSVIASLLLISTLVEYGVTHFRSCNPRLAVNKSMGE
jgi:hypothetical protein